MKHLHETLTKHLKHWNVNKFGAYNQTIKTGTNSESSDEYKHNNVHFCKHFLVAMFTNFDSLEYQEEKICSKIIPFAYPSY